MSAPRLISSRDNPLLKRLRLLARGPERTAAGDLHVLVDGIHLAQVVLRHDRDSLRHAVFESERLARLDELQALLRSLPIDVPCSRVPAALMASLYGSETGQGVILLIERSAKPVPAGSRQGIEVWLDRVQDPGNLGTLLRTAAAAGVSRALLSPGCASAWSPKSLRAGQGAQWLLPVHEQVDLEAQAVQAGLPLLVTALEDAQSLWDTALPAQCAWVFGHEGQGVSAGLQERASQRLRIPMQAGSESLNVGVAAGICLFEHCRQLSLS
jgi:TrmH family RNA methyltransferase